ncbi:MAG TPA: AsnC family transcriptional regulator [Lachnospiraceae bacterium]|nr:Rrf2 family transcriptional regulator [uncultured Lachnoclostridium sp.]HAU84469.1 AsnC family transcriptional regulator [Lachnospiraceae bacterium]
MKISTKGRYGLRAVLDLAMNSETEAVALSSIAERQHISVSYLEQLVSKLRKAGIVNSIRGAQGGYVLAKPADEISVGDILRALEGDLHPVDCAEVYGGDSVCQGADVCVSKFVWKRISDSISQAVDTLMLSDLAEEGKALLSNQSEESKKDKPYCH